MKFSRTDFVPVLAIICGGAVGVFASASLVLSSPADEVPAPDPVVVPSATVELATDGRRYVIQMDDPVRFPRGIVRRLPEVTDRQGVSPLIYIDGVRNDVTSFLEILSPEEIERIEILKGDAAIALYGEEGSGGVIRITLKADVPTGR